MPHEKPPECRRNDRVEIRRVKLFGERSAKARGLVRILEQQGALEKLTAMATRAKDKVPFEEGPGRAEFGEDSFWSHGFFWVFSRAEG